MSRYKAYPAYRDTETKWLGVIPSNWNLFDGKRLFSSRRESAREGDEQLAASQKYGVVPQSLMMEMNDAKVMLALKGTSSFRHVGKNDFVISLRSFEGGIEHSSYVGCVSPAYTVLQAEKSVAPAYFKYLLKSGPYIAALQASTDSLRDGKSISYEQFGAISLPYPMPEEQAAIAAFLDYETAKIDALIEKQQRLIELLKEKRQAVISHAVTKGLNPNAPMKDSGVEWLGEVPSHWTVVPLKHLCVLLKDGTHLPPPRVDEGVPLLSVRNIVNGQFVLREDDSLISHPAFETLCKSFTPIVGDVLLAIVGATLGKVAIVKDMPPFHIQRSLAVFRTKADFLTCEFLANVFSSIGFQSLLWENAGFSAQPGIYLGTLANFKMPIPPKDEQFEIDAYCNAKASKMNGLISKAESVISLMHERRTALISAAVTGKIDVRDWQAAD
jgi:type I restriction enzyme S subunit